MTTTVELRPLSYTVVRALGYGEVAGAALALLAVGAPDPGVAIGGIVGVVGAAVVHSPRFESADVSSSTIRARARVWRWLSAGLMATVVVSVYSLVVFSPAIGFFDSVPDEPSPAASFVPLAVIALASVALLLHGLRLGLPDVVPWHSPLFAIALLATAYAAMTAAASVMAIRAG